MRDLEEVRYADAGRIVAASLAALLPPERIPVDAYAEQHRYLSNEGGGYVGRFTFDGVEYLREPHQCLTVPELLTMAVVGPGQCAKTTIAENWFQHSIETDPADILWYMQTDDGVEAYVKDRVNRMIEQHDGMRSRMGTRPTDDSLHYKGFQGMKAEFLSATSSNLINKRAPRIVADEIDAYPPGLGDVKTLLDVRRQTFGEASMLFALSHPDRATGLDPERDWTAGIMAIYADSDRRVWYWKCPHCGAYSSPVPITSRVMTLQYPADAPLDAVEVEARLVCPVSGCLVEDHERREMNRTGLWVGQGQEISEAGRVTGDLIRHKTAGFWIVGAMSPFIIGGIGALARAKAKAEREMEVSGDDQSLRTVVVKQWGFPYKRPAGDGSISAEALAERADERLKLDQVPEGVRFLTVGVDCQKAHFEWLVRGWGVDAESWVIARGRLPGDPATSAADWDRLYDEVLIRAWPLSDGSGRSMRPRAAGFDLGGEAGTSGQGYAAWRRWRRRPEGRVIKTGKIAGRDAWTILPTQGAPGELAAHLAVVYPDTHRKASKFAGGEVPVARFNVNQFKDSLAGHLKTAEAGAGHVHFPAALKSKEPPHLWFEQLVAEVKDARGRWEKPHAGVRNEALDLMVMCHVLAHLHGLSRITWASPPAWARGWDEGNSLIVAASGASPEIPVETGAPVVRPPASAEVRPSGTGAPATVGPRIITQAPTGPAPATQTIVRRLA